MPPGTLRVFARVGVRRIFRVVIPVLAYLHRKAHGVPDWPRTFDRILVIRVDLLGDVLFSMQAVQGLRRAYPSARICMLTLPYTAPLARLYPSVDEVFTVDTNRIRRPGGLLSPRTWLSYWRVYRQLNAERFDVAISLSGPMASLCALLSGARRVVGYADEAYRFTLTDPVSGGRYEERKHEVEYVRSLARRAGATEFPAHLEVPVPADASRRVEQMLGEHGVRAGDTLVAVHAGSINGSAKRWLPEYWGPLADRLQGSGSRIVLVGARSDEPIAREVMAAAERPIISLVGRTDIEELIALIARADLVATGDSGPLHLAVALGRPLVSVYGPTDPYIHGPFNPAAPVAIHRKDLACSPCYSMAATAECPLGHTMCMRLVPVADMVESAGRLLAHGGALSAPLSNPVGQGFSPVDHHDVSYLSEGPRHGHDMSVDTQASTGGSSSLTE